MHTEPCCSTRLYSLTTVLCTLSLAVVSVYTASLRYYAHWTLCVLLDVRKETESSSVHLAVDTHRRQAYNPIENVESRTQTMKQTISKSTVHKYRRRKHQLIECWAEWLNDIRNQVKARCYSVDNRGATEWFIMLLRHYILVSIL